MDHSSILNLPRDTWKVSCWHRWCSVAKQPRSGKLSRGVLGKVKGNRRGCTPLIVSPLVQSLYQLLNCPNGPLHFGPVLNLIEVLSYVTVEGDEMEGGQRSCVQANATKHLLESVWRTDSGCKGAVAVHRWLTQTWETMSDKSLMENVIRRPEI